MWRESPQGDKSECPEITVLKLQAMRADNSIVGEQWSINSEYERMKKSLLCLTPMLAIVHGCATQSEERASSTAINQAITMCGIGSESQASTIYKAAFDITRNRAGTLSFETNMAESIKAQQTTLLQSLGEKSPDSTTAIIEEIGRTRECVIAQSRRLLPRTRAEALEDCRLDVQRRISPPGTMQYGVLRYWNQLPDDPDYSSTHPIMSGVFDTGGTSSFSVRVRCEMSNGRFEEALILRPRS